MYFTQEDYKKIEDWLHRNSVKDTEFQEALPFTGKEIVTIVQDGYNRKVNIQEFINQLYKHGVEDFLNITNTYKANNITLKEAIRLIPSEARKEGQVITFLNTEGNWEIYQFIGKLNQWNNPTLWNNPFDWEKLIIDSTLPDEEDLTKSAPDVNGNAYLSLKDRKYEPDKYSGLGRKILRRRVVEIEDPVYGTQEKNLLLQADFDEDNTVYVVRYDFTLNGQDITLPINSYIEYEGGSISDGNIIEQEGGLSRIVLRKNTINGVNILTQNMISKSNTIYEIRYDFDLNGQNIEIPENCMLDFQGGNITNGVLFSNKTQVMNIPKGLYILGRIFNSAGQEITTRGDVIKRNTKLVFAFNVLTSSKFDYIYDKYGISTKVKGLYDVGVTECYVDITLVKSTSSNGSVTITPDSEYISDESFIKYLKSQGIFHDIQALRFNISNDLNTEEAPNNIMPPFNSCVLKTLKSLKDKGLKFESVYIANEREDWINPDNSRYKPEYVNYLIDLANSIRELGYIPVINSANFYLLQNVDSRLYDYVEPTYNFYPNISFSDEKTVYSPELSNSVKEQFDFRVPVWNGKYKTSTIGICESGTNSRKKALRFPGQSDLAELGDPWYNAKVVFHEIVADIINYYSIPYYGIWYTESFTNDVDKDKLYNIFVNKIK